MTRPHVQCCLILLAIVSFTRPAFAQAQGYKRETGIAYRSGEVSDELTKSRCLLDIDHPADKKGFSTIIWFHGGGLTGGNRELPPGLAGKGHAIVAPGYRLSPGVKAPAYIEDAAAAVAWTFKNIGRFGGDPDRIVLSGGSAGGYLAHIVGLDKRWLAAHGIDANRLAGIAPISGNTVTHFTIRDERGIPPTRPVIDDLAPLHHVRADAPPILLVTGDRELELLGRYEENAYFWRMMKLAGHKDCMLHELGGFDHGGVFEPSFRLLLEFTNRVTKSPSKS
jgi:acetyl esterase/lipase